MYVSMKNILQHAGKHGYAVMAMNSINMEMARAGIEAAQEERAAIIINIGMGQMKKHAHLEDMAPMVRKMAKRVDVPVALLLLVVLPVLVFLLSEPVISSTMFSTPSAASSIIS